jgi:hypothetical protein
VSESQLDSYFQLGNSAPTDAYQPGEDKQRIDLTEFYRDSDQDNATVMVMGAEELALGKLSKRTAILLSLSGTESYDPFPSERNARMGTEGFFSTIAEGFKKFIETIIKYIRMAIDWVIDLIQGIFGFRKSARINEEINKSLDEMKIEFAKTLNGLGFPGNVYNVETFLGDLPPNQDRQAQLHLLRSKFDKDSDQVKKLSDTVPLLQQAMGKIKQIGERAERTFKTFKKTLGEEFNRSKVRHHTANNTAPLTEVNRVMKAIEEATLALDSTELVGLVSKTYSTLFGITFTNEELTNGFTEVQKKLQENVKLEVVKLDKVNVGETLSNIQDLNTRYMGMVSDEIDISKVNWKAMGTMIDRSDAEKVELMSKMYNAPTMLANYQKLSLNIRNFTQFCFFVTNELRRVEKQITDLIEWHQRTHAYYYAGFVNDLDKLKEIVLDAQSKGHAPLIGNDHMVFIKAADAQTFMEKLSANINFGLENDIGGLKTIVNNFSKQTGWGKLI